MEEQTLYAGQTRGMNADDWRGFTTNLLAKLPELLMVLTSEQMNTRLKSVIENIDGAKDAVMEAAKASADLLVEAAVDVLAVFGEGQTVPVMQTRGVDIVHDAIMGDLAAALTVPRLGDKDTGNLFEG